jgi:polysaccharide deacetylase family protein (PEP-CTERM system associated)
VLGWIAEKVPGLVREIHARGHEIASHGYFHKLAGMHAPNELKRDLSDSKKFLEDLTGFPVNGYRALSFSVNPQVLELVEECGYTYDSSLNSFSVNPRYGSLNLSKRHRKGIAYRVTGNLHELPISNARIFGCAMPAGGGAYFRLIPFPLFLWMARSLVKSEGAYLFYMHPWELDPGQPRVQGVSPFSMLRHYSNLHKTMAMLSRLVECLRGCVLIGCERYLAHLESLEKLATF